MIARTSRETVAFSRPFLLEGIDRVLPAGKYEVVTDEELIEGLSFAAYRRVATMMMVPTPTSVEMFAIEPAALVAAQQRDSQPAAAPKPRGEGR
jgi:hypothetical protein